MGLWSKSLWAYGLNFLASALLIYGSLVKKNYKKEGHELLAHVPLWDYWFNRCYSGEDQRITLRTLLPCLTM